MLPCVLEIEVHGVCLTPAFSFFVRNISILVGEVGGPWITTFQFDHWTRYRGEAQVEVLVEVFVWTLAISGERGDQTYLLRTCIGSKF